MPSRRQLLATAGAALLMMGPAALWAGCVRRDTSRAGTAERGTFPLERTDVEWRAMLTPEQYRVLRGHGTERAFTSPLNDERRAGTYACAGCGQTVFSSAAKYDSGTGWPSFWEPLEGAIGTSLERSLLMVRTEVHCARCGGHLGHVFTDGPRPTGLRYCINGVALVFLPENV